MKITTKQAHVLDNLHRIQLVVVCRTKRAMLDGVDCRPQLVSLGAMKLIRWDGQRQPTKIAETKGKIAETKGMRGHAGRVRSAPADGSIERSALAPAVR